MSQQQHNRYNNNNQQFASDRYFTNNNDQQQQQQQQQQLPQSMELQAGRRLSPIRRKYVYDNQSSPYNNRNNNNNVSSQQLPGNANNLRLKLNASPSFQKLASYEQNEYKSGGEQQQQQPNIQQIKQAQVINNMKQQQLFQKGNKNSIKMNSNGGGGGYDSNGKSKESFFYPNVDSSRVKEKIQTAEAESWKIRRKVTVKMHLRRILSIDIYNKRFSMVFNVDFAWPDIEQKALDAVKEKKKLPWTPKILFPNSIDLTDISKTKMISVKPSPIPNGWPTVIERRKFRGTFSLPNQSVFNFPFEVFDASIVIESGHSPDEIEFVGPIVAGGDEESLTGGRTKKQNLVKIDWEFFVHPIYELIMNHSNGGPEVTLEFHSGDTELDTAPRLYIDVKFQRKSISQFVIFVVSYFVLNQISWILLILEVDTYILGILTLIFVIMLIHVALRVRFAKDIPPHEYVLLPDSYRYFSSIHMILLMSYFCSIYNQKPTPKTNIISVFLPIIISLHIIAHIIFICEILYARRTEKSKIELTSYYQSIIKYGPRILDNHHVKPSNRGVRRNADVEEESGSSSSDESSNNDEDDDDDENSDSSGMLNYSVNNDGSPTNKRSKSPKNGRNNPPKKFWDNNTTKNASRSSKKRKKSNTKRTRR